MTLRLPKDIDALARARADAGGFATAGDMLRDAKMTRRRRTFDMHTLWPLRIMLVCLGLAQVAAAHSAESTPDATVRKAYAVTQKTLEGGGEPPWRPPHRDQLMSRSLAALFARDDRYQDESGEIGHIGADPFIQGQDGEVKSLAVTVTQAPAGGKALVTARFRSFGKAISVPFRMVEEGGGWRIDDIGSGRNSVRRDGPAL